jgi:hypothetical protein
VPLIASNNVPFTVAWEADCSKRHALVQLDVVGDLACFADHDAGSVVNEE